METNFDQHGLSCENCGERLITDGYETYCAEGCGLVVDAQTFDTAPIWKTDDAGNPVGQQHGPPQVSGLGFAVGSVMSYGNRDASGRALSADPAARTRVHRMRRVQNHGKTGPQRADTDMGRAVRALAGRLTLPKSVESRAVYLMREMWKLKMTRGRPWSILAGTALLIGSRESGGSLRPIDVAEVIEPDDNRVKSVKFRLARSYRNANRALGTAILPLDALAHLPRMIGELGLSRDTEKVARRLLTEHPLTTSGSPLVHCAAAILVATKFTNERRSQKEVVKGTRACSEVALRHAALRFPQPPEKERKRGLADEIDTIRRKLG